MKLGNPGGQLLFDDAEIPNIVPHEEAMALEREGQGQQQKLGGERTQRNPAGVARVVAKKDRVKNVLAQKLGEVAVANDNEALQGIEQAFSFLADNAQVAGAGGDADDLGGDFDMDDQGYGMDDDPVNLAFGNDDDVDDDVRRMDAKKLDLGFDDAEEAKDPKNKKKKRSSAKDDTVVQRIEHNNELRNWLAANYDVDQKKSGLGEEGGIKLSDFINAGDIDPALAFYELLELQTHNEVECEQYEATFGEIKITKVNLSDE